MGTVHRARDEFLGRDVAVKLIEPPVVNADDLRRDEDEVKLLARLNHHGLVTLFDAGADVSDDHRPRIYLVMELIDGPDLRDRLAQGPLRSLDVAQIGSDLAKALTYVHDHGVVHRDVKPANIMMFDYGHDAARVRAKLTDFGIAVLMEAPLSGGNGSFIGTAAYVSPEQAKGEPLGPASDIYSLGLVLLECLTGVKSFPGDPLPSALARLLHGPDIPASLDPQWLELLTVMTATDPGSRPTAADSARALTEIIVAQKTRHTGTSSVMPPDEAARLEAVHRYQILDTPADGAFDRITALASRLFSVPIAIVSVVDRDRIWFKSHHGLEVAQVDREPGLCASAILQDEPWIIEDARLDSRALSNPLVAGELGLQFYAGIPLHTRDGYNLGTLCIIDREPRTMSHEDLTTLEDLAAIVMHDLEQRMQSRLPA
ncbi:GAF domain-containing serine/threonine-protein kinase [Nostocoides sp. HKS02]|uniref:protein kinase domain-containing protein n=1 Tax=Nostocoides sp. HKS02 TaxID=1813880 RepID=UPI001E40C970|nr:GAF domain-containing serine/threonine-protein kinase [Tetrasphaera sp. HKS02]